MSSDPYRWIARWYDALFERMNSGLRSIGLKLFPPEEGMAVLDVGCGTGVQLEAYLRRGCRVFGVDPSPAMLRVARGRLGATAELSAHDATRMPYDDASFDLVMASLVLHELSPAVRAAVLGEMRRIVKTDGRILVIDYHPGTIRHPQGWLTRVVILLAEILAGRRHFRNYRRFMADQGLLPVARENRLAVVTQKVVSGGNVGIYLLRRQ